MELNDIDNCHRVGKSPVDGRPRAIIVKLSSDAGTDSREVPAPAEPHQQHAGRRPGSRATTHNAPAVSEADPDSRHDHDDADSRPNHDDSDSRPDPDVADQTIEFTSKWAIYINEALCKSRSKLSFATRDLKRKGKIHDTWTIDGRIKIKTTYNGIKNIETMADLEEYICTLLYSCSIIALIFLHYQ